MATGPPPTPANLPSIVAALSDRIDAELVKHTTVGPSAKVPSWPDLQTKHGVGSRRLAELWRFCIDVNALPFEMADACARRRRSALHAFRSSFAVAGGGSTHTTVGSLADATSTSSSANALAVAAALAANPPPSAASNTTAASASTAASTLAPPSAFCFASSSEVSVVILPVSYRYLTFF